MFDFLKNFKKEWIPEEILTDNRDVNTFVSNNSTDIEELALAQRLADHLNTIMDYEDRIDSLDYLATKARANFDNITFTTMDEGLINAIISIDGKDGVVDFELAQHAVELVIEWIDQTALESLTGLI